MHEDMRKDRQSELLNGGDAEVDDDGYLSLKGKSSHQPTPEQVHVEVTFEMIEKMAYTEFNEDKDDDFKPSDIVDEE